MLKDSNGVIEAVNEMKLMSERTLKWTRRFDPRAFALLVALSGSLAYLPMLKKFLMSSLNKSYRKKEKETGFVLKSAENRLRETFVDIALSNLDRNKENFQETKSKVWNWNFFHRNLSKNSLDSSENNIMARYTCNTQSVLQFKMKLETQTKEDRIPKGFTESFRKTKINVVTRELPRTNFFSPILTTLTLLLTDKSRSSNKTQLESCGRVHDTTLWKLQTFPMWHHCTGRVIFQVLRFNSWMFSKEIT